MNIIETNLQWNGALTYNNYPNKIVLHNADASSCTIEDIHQWHLNNGWLGCGYHFLVRKDGSVYRGRSENAQGSHCPGANTSSIGICFEGKYMEETMPSIQYNAGIELINYLFNKYGTLAIYGHKDLYSTDCPGTNFPLDDFKGMKTGNQTGWIKNSTGWWYKNSDSSFPKDCWKEIDGQYYSFDLDGYARQSKWIQDQGCWFYLKDNCMMAKNEWLWIDGECYYFADKGALYLNCYTPDGYWVDSTGAWDNTVPQKK
jgi:hypothetical protein